MSRSSSPNHDSAILSPPAPGTHHQRLRRLRDRERQRRQSLVAIAAGVVVMLLAALIASIDYRYELSAGLRLLAWGAVAVALVSGIVVAMRWARFDMNNTVRESERIWPDLGQRLRTSHDYQETPDAVAAADPELIRALESETEDRVAHQPPTPLASSWPIGALLGIGVVTALVWTTALLIWPEARIATARLWFVPVHYTTVAMEPLPDRIDQGSDLMVQLHVEGRPLKSATLRYRSSSEQAWSQLDFQPAAGKLLIQDLEAVLSDCQDDLELEVEAGPFHAGTHQVAVTLPLLLEQWKAKVKPPTYTQLPDAEGSPGELRIPEGSALQLQAQYNRPPTDVAVEVRPQSPAPAETSVAESVATLKLASVNQPTDLQVHAQASDLVRDDSSLHLEVIPDSQPRLQFVAPQEGAEAIATAELQFTLQSLDDYGLSSVGIRYRIDDGPEQTLWESDSDKLDRSFMQTVVLPLEELDVSYPQAITYYAYALDNREPQPQRVTSDLRFVDIRPFSREYEFRDSQGNCQGECLSLEKLIQEQRRILGDTFASVQRGASPVEVGSRLASDESELRDNTESLTAALEEKVGPMPSLVLASRSMFDAQNELQDGELAAGQVHEEHALASLIQARTNLRKILKSGSSQAQMCRNVDQQQMDQIRKPQSEQQESQKQDQQQEQQLAELRKELRQLASQQQSFCQSASACQQASQNQSSSSSSRSNSSTSQSETATRRQLASQQSESADAARDIQSRLEQGRFGDLASKRVEEAAELIQRSSESISRDDGYSDAIDQAKQAADRLERVSEHLGQRHDPDFLEKLATAERQSQHLSDEQSRLSQLLKGDRDGNQQAGQTPDASRTDEDGTDTSESHAGSQDTSLADQQRLADRTEELADLIDQLLADSISQDWEVQRELSEQTSQHSPHDAASQMQEAAQEIDRGNLPRAVQQGENASSRLERLASGLREVHRASGEDRLNQLIDAEQRAAALLRSLQRGASAAEQSMARAQTQQFADDLHSLARHDRELWTASQSLAESYAASSTKMEAPQDEFDQNTEAVFASPPTNQVEALRQVDVLLQRRIQEAIVGGVVQQAVGAVPPQYSEMVDQYYRALSEDIE